MSEFIVVNTANDAWKTATRKIMKDGIKTTGRTGDVHELLHTFITIYDPRQKWVYDRFPPMSIAFALAEVVWIMNGENRSDIINAWNPILEKYAGSGDIYYGAYGKRIKSHFGFDQMEKAYHALRNKPESRQVVIQIYDTKFDFPIENGKPRSEDIPCNICSMIKISGKKLEWSQIMRSNDVLRGMPYNIVQFTCLQEILAGWLNLEVGSYNHYSDSLHLYNNDKKKIRVDLDFKMNNNDSLSISKEHSETIFIDLFERMKNLIRIDLTKTEIFTLSHLESVYSSYNNIMFILGAYIALKKQYNGLSNELVEKCTNNLYKIMWHNWCKNKNWDEGSLA